MGLAVWRFCFVRALCALLLVLFIPCQYAAAGDTAEHEAVATGCRQQGEAYARGSGSGEAEATAI